MRSRRILVWPSAALVAALAAGCAVTPAVRVQQIDGRVACATIAAFPAPADAPPSTIVDQRLGAEILRWLVAAGVDTSSAAPACWVRHATQVRAAVAPSSGVNVGLGAGSWGRSGTSVGLGVGITLPVGEGSRRDLALTIEIVDVARRQQVWTATLDDALPSAPSDAQIAGAVDTILARLRPALVR